MPAESPGIAHSSFRTAFEQRRRSARRACVERIIIRWGQGEFAAEMLDLSAGGIGVRIDSLVALKPGTRIILISARLGELPCVLRWAAHPRYGAEFLAGERALTRVDDFYDGLPPAPGERP